MLQEHAVDDRSVIIYVSSLYDALALAPKDIITGNRRKLPIPPLLGDVSSAASIPLASQSDLGDLQAVWQEYRALTAELMQWCRATCDRLASRHFPSDLDGMRQQVVVELKRHRREELPTRERQRQQLIRLYADLEVGLFSPCYSDIFEV